MIDLVRSGADVIVLPHLLPRSTGWQASGSAIPLPAKPICQRIQSHLMSFGGNLAGLEYPAAILRAMTTRPFSTSRAPPVLEGRSVLIMDAVAKAGRTSRLPGAKTNCSWSSTVPDADALRDDHWCSAASSIRGASTARGKVISRVSTGTGKTWPALCWGTP